MNQIRRLAAILAADVAGYSRLMGADEEGTLERLKALRRELLDPKIAEHRGRIVKTTGDGMLVEFASVVDAVRCAVEVQQAMPERNTGVAADNRIEQRIGICRQRSPRSPIRTKRWSTICCSARRPRRCSPSPPIPGTWAPTSASPPCSTAGARR